MVVFESVVGPNELLVDDLQRLFVVEQARSLVLEDVELRVGAGGSSSAPHSAPARGNDVLRPKLLCSLLVFLSLRSNLAHHLRAPVNTIPLRTSCDGPARYSTSTRAEPTRRGSVSAPRAAACDPTAASRQLHSHRPPFVAHLHYEREDQPRKPT